MREFKTLTTYLSWIDDPQLKREYHRLKTIMQHLPQARRGKSGAIKQLNFKRDVRLLSSKARTNIARQILRPIREQRDYHSIFRKSFVVTPLG